VKVLVTGSSSRLARALLPLLCAEEQVTHVTGVDIAPPHFAHEKFHAEQGGQGDIRSPRVQALLAGHDALVHLAFVVLRGRMPLAAMAEINVAASHQLFLAARAAGVRRLVHLSSASVYGAGGQLTEDAPLAPLADFAYGQHKAQLERRLQADVPGCVRLRPHVILGPHAQPLLRRLLRLPLYLALPDPQPRLQCVHEDDVARAILAALERDVSGVFNLAAPDVFHYRDLIRGAHRVALALPPPLARAALTAAWRLTGWGGEPAWVAGLAQTLTLDCARAQRELGWQARHDSMAAVRESL
jgi:UDP-glucose 4-epimerase